MPLTNYDALLEAWADEAVAMEQNMEALYGPPATDPTLPPITNYDGMLEAIVEATEGIRDKLLDQSPIYHNKDSAYVKTVPAHVSQALLQVVGGKTIVWNQLGDFGTVVWESGNKGVAFTQGTPIYAGHKYYFCGTITSATNVDIRVYTRKDDTNKIEGRVYKDTPATIFTATNDGVSNGTQVASNGNIWLYMNVTSGDSATNIMLVDMTLMFGSGNEPTTVQEFQQMFPASYYPYDSGSLLSAGVTEVKSVGKNLLDAQTVFAGTSSTDIVINDGEWDVIKPSAVYTKHLWDNTDGYKGQLTISYYKKDSGSSGSGYKMAFVYTDGTVDAVNSNHEDSYAYKTLTSNASKIVQYVGGSYNQNQETYIKNAQIEYGTTATDYTPYHAPIQYPIPASVQALEGYGWSAGSVYNYIDFERKVFVKNVGRVDLGTLSWIYSSAGNGFLYSSVINDIKTPTGWGYLSNIVNALYTPIIPNSFSTNSANKNMSINPTNQILVRDDAYTDAPTFKTAMDGVYLYYELATPIETDISAYIDDNTISVESGGTITFENANGDDYRIDVPSDIKYVIDVGEA